MSAKTDTLALIAIIMLAARVIAQTAPESTPGPVTAGMLPPKAGMITMRVEDMDTPNVKGAPFCATVTTEHTQSFAARQSHPHQ